MTSEEPKNRLSDLTDRQLEILRLYCEDLKCREIGERLYITAGTVRSHLGHIRDKLGFTPRELRRHRRTLFSEEAATAPESPSVPQPPTPEPQAPVQQVPHEPQGSTDTSGLRKLLVGVALGAILVCAVGTVGVLALRRVLFGATPATPTAEIREATVVVTATPESPGPSPTVREVVVTEEVEREVTVVVTATPTNAPAATDTPTRPAATDTPVPIPTSTRPPEPTPRPAHLLVGEAWEENDVELILKAVNYEPDSECIAFRFDVYNDSDHAMVVSLDFTDFVVTDNLGRRWSNYGSNNWWCNAMLKGGTRESRTVDPGEYFGQIQPAYQGFLTDPDVDYVELVANTSKVTDAVWRIVVDN